jgi:cyanate lyase
MTTEITQQLLDAKKAKGLSFEDIGQHLGYGEVWVAALFYRQATASSCKLISSLFRGASKPVDKRF